MKKLKISLSALAFVLAFCLSAFTAPKAPAVNAPIDGWFQLGDGLDPLDRINYTYVSDSPNCSGTDEPCAFRGTKETASDYPTSGSFNTAKSISDDFTHAVTDEVEFRTP